MSPSTIKVLSIFLACTLRLALPFLGHVLHILLMCTQKEMRRIYTGRVVFARTVVANLKAFRDWAKMNKPGCAMTTHVMTVYPQHAIAISVSSATPEPTFIGRFFDDMLPKTFGKRKGGVFTQSIEVSYLESCFLIASGWGNRLSAATFAEFCCVLDWSWLLRIMTVDIPLRLTLDPSFTRAITGRKLRLATAAAKTETARIGVIVIDWIGKVMAACKSHRLALDVSELLGRLARKVGLLAAATATVAGLNFIKGKLELGKVWGMLRHVDFLLLGNGQARGIVKMLPGILIGELQENYSTNTPIGQAL